jgi:D-cysteine desulfhydrase
MAPYLAVKYAGLDRGRRPYMLPPGGSTPLGALGYVNAGLELAAQVGAGELPQPEAIILPVGTGGTAAGLALGLGLAGLRTRIVGIAITRAPTTWALTVRRLALATAGVMRRNGMPSLEAPIADVSVHGRWLGGGYGRPTAQSEEASRLMAADEGVELEPTYTAKTVSGLVQMCRARELRGPVLYWHTYDARMGPDDICGPAEHAGLPREFRRFCPPLPGR